MEENNDMGKDELLEWARLNNVSMSEGQAKDLVNDKNQDVDLDKWLKENGMSPIGEYEKLSDRMRKKIADIIASLKDEKDKDHEEQSDDRDEKDNLDEKDGKEELDKDKKKEVEEREKENSEKSDDKEDKDKEKAEEENEIEDDDKDKKQEETPKKDEYLAKVKKLHEMKLVDYKDQMKHDDPRKDKYFMTMIVLQRDVNRQREAFIKAYGKEELQAMENEYLKEELKYKKTLNVRMERDLGRLRQLDQKLDSILDRMQTLQKGVEDKSISLEEYNDEINSLEKEKLDTLWEINRLNPELLEKKQENIKERDNFEKRVSPQNLQKKKDIADENQKKFKEIDYKGRKQDGKAKAYNQEIKDSMQNDIDEKEKRLDELRKELRGTDIESVEGKKRALEIIDEIQTLESQKMSEELQQENMEKNMSSGVESYGDLERSEKQRQADTESFEELHDSINPESASNDLMEQLKNEALHDPETPEQAEQYLENIEDKAEDVAEKDESSKEEKSDDYVPTLFNKRKPH